MYQYICLMRTVHAVIGEYWCNSLCCRGFRGGGLRTREAKGKEKLLRGKWEKRKKAPASKHLASVVPVSGS